MDDRSLQDLYQVALETQPGQAEPPITLERLEDLAEGKVPESEALSMLDQVMADPELRREYALLLARREPAGSLPLRIPRPWMALAASLTLAMAGVLWWQGSNPASPDRVLRGGDSMILVSPLPDGVADVGPVELTWRSVPGAVRYRIELLDGQGTAVVRTETTDTTLGLEEGFLTPGTTYRWWVEAVGPGITARSRVTPFSVAPGG